MANIPSASTYINDIEVAADAPVTESLMSEIGGSVNYSLDRDAEFIPIKAKVDAIFNVDTGNYTMSTPFTAHVLYTVPTGKQFVGFLIISIPASSGDTGFGFAAARATGFATYDIYCLNSSTLAGAPLGTLTRASSGNLAAYTGAGEKFQTCFGNTGNFVFMVPINLFSTGDIYLSQNGVAATYRLVGTEIKF